MLADLGEKPVAIALQFRMQVLIGRGHRNIDQVRPQICRQHDVLAIHPAPHHQTCIQSQGSDCPDACALGVAHRGDPDFQLGNSQCIEATGDIDLFVETERDSRRLLSVAQGRVVDEDVSWGYVGHGSQERKSKFLARFKYYINYILANNQGAGIVLLATKL
jgi:hypothetical protein